MVRRAAGIPRAGGGGRRGSRVREEAGDGIPRAGEDFFVGPTETSPN
jgi:hypothetical protein